MVLQTRISETTQYTEKSPAEIQQITDHPIIQDPPNSSLLSKNIFSKKEN